MVSIEFAFNRFRTSKAMVGLPSSVLNPVASLKVLWIFATSLRVITPKLSLRIGRSRISCSVSMSAGILIPKRPSPASISPAGINKLLALSICINSPAVILYKSSFDGFKITSTTSSRCPLRLVSST